MSTTIAPIPGQRVYLCGPMTGIDKHNYPLFNKVARDLRVCNLIVCNPAENFGGSYSLSRTEFMRIDLGHILWAEAVVLLPGWEKSTGATLEVAIAKELGIPLMLWDLSQRTLSRLTPSH